VSEEEGFETPPVQLPIAPGAVKMVALAELDRAQPFVQNLSMADWTRASKVAGWTIGDVVTHIGLTIALYSRVLDAARAGRTAGGVWKVAGRIGKRVAPAASPALNALNRAVPRLIDKSLAPEVIKGQFSASVRLLRTKVDAISPEDFTRPIYYMGSAWPLSFFLAGLVDEISIHCWDCASVLDQSAALSEQARSVIPWYFWSGTSLMLRLPKGTIGTVQVSLDDPPAAMWWKLRSDQPLTGAGRVDSPDVTIAGASGMFSLVIAGRITLDAAEHITSLRLQGDRQIAQQFMSAWKIV